MNLTNKINHKNLFNFKHLVILFFFILYLIRLNLKYFYDDEIGSIEIISNFDNIFSLYKYVNIWDVSPPLSYVLIFLGEKLFSFNFAPLILLPLQIFCINQFVNDTEANFIKDNLIKNSYYISIYLNPIFLLWCTSLRWYSLWVPLAIFLIGNLYFKKNRKETDYFIILLFLTLMHHLSYLTYIFFLSLYLSKFKELNKEFINFANKRLYIFIFFIIINLPQIYFLINFHFPNSSSQFGSYFFSLIYPLITIIFGNSVFPFETISLLLTLCIVFVFFKNFKVIKYSKFEKLIKFFFIFFLFLIILKLGHKPRHSIILNYIFIFFLFLNIQNLKNKIFQKILTFIFIIFSVFGIKNTIKEQNVIKNNINIPIQEILYLIKNEKKVCEKKFIFTYNLNLKFYLKDNPNYILNDKTIDLKNIKCSFVIKTFIGGDDIEEVNFINKTYNKFKSQLKQKEIMYDKFYLLKEKLFKNKIKNRFIIKILY